MATSAGTCPTDAMVANGSCRFDPEQVAAAFAQRPFCDNAQVQLPREQGDRKRQLRESGSEFDTEAMQPVDPGKIRIGKNGSVNLIRRPLQNI